jgi:hypothetical protein
MADSALQSSDESDAPAQAAALSATLASAKGRNTDGDDGLIAAETLKLGIETRHLRLRYFDERLSVALKRMAIPAGTLAAAGLVAMAWSASQDHALVVEPFSTLPAFRRRREVRSCARQGAPLEPMPGRIRQCASTGRTGSLAGC